MQLFFKERGNPLLRFLDRYVGIPLVSVLGRLRRKKSLPKTLDKIGVIKLSGIGDVVLLARWIRALKLQHPNAEVVFLSGKANAGMASFVNADRHEVLSVFSPFKTLKLLCNERFSVLIDAESWSRISALFTLFSKARFQIGYKTPSQFKHAGFDKVSEYQFNRHEIQNMGGLFEPLGVKEVSLAPLQHLKGSKQEGLLVVHLFPGGSRSYLKEWPAEHWQKLFCLLAPLHLDIYATGTAKDKERVEEVIHGYGVQNVCGEFSLLGTGELLAKAQCVISVDTGIMHLAAALDAATIALHGPTSANRWGGVGGYVYPVAPDMDYKPCIQLGFESTCKVGKCMRAISPEVVFQAVKECLKGVAPLTSAADGKVMSVCNPM